MTDVNDRDSQDDLRAFQAKHFSPSLSTTETLDIEEDEDSLGYYADGVKRTLTDEQIRIFRHSEIYSLLRARQLEPSEDPESGDPSTITSPLPEVDSQGRAPSNTAEPPNTSIVQSGEDDTMKQKKGISGATEPTRSARRPKKRQGKKPAGKSRTLGYHEDQLPVDETGTFARRILSYED
jgi:hypothetical protein